MGRRRNRRLAKRRTPFWRNPAWVLVISMALTLGVGGVGLLTLIPSPPGSTAAEEALPAFAKRTTNTREAYLFAAQNPGALQYIPCYCGCGQNNGHRNNEDCFIRSRQGDTIVYEAHGST